MEGFGWFVVIVLLLLFGKNLKLNVGQFTNNQAVPGPLFGDVPVVNIQDQTNGPVATAAPWKSNAPSTCPDSSAPAYSGIAVTADAVPLNVSSAAPANRPRVTFQQSGGY